MVVGAHGDQVLVSPCDIDHTPALLTLGVVLEEGVRQAGGRMTNPAGLGPGSWTGIKMSWKVQCGIWQMIPCHRDQGWSFRGAETVTRPAGWNTRSQESQDPQDSQD